MEVKYIRKKSNRKLLLSSIVIVIVIVCFFAFDTRLAVRCYTITTDKVNNNIRIAFIADLHSCYYGEGQCELLDAVTEQHPDIILLGGDIADDELPHDNTEILLEALTNLYPCYYVTGNHEFWSGEVEEIKKIFRSYGVTVLEGEGQPITLHGQPINVCGVDDTEIGEDEYLQQIEDSLQNVDTSLYTFFLAHRPEYIDWYLQYDFDLILSGHAHGGQWRIPGLLNGLLAPGQGFFPKFAGGLYEFENKTFIVSRGLARESTRVPRIFNRPELVIINITSKIHR